jgi:hypothetical protein
VPNITISRPRLNPVIAACEACRKRKVKVYENVIVAGKSIRNDDWLTAGGSVPAEDRHVGAVSNDT